MTRISTEVSEGIKHGKCIIPKSMSKVHCDDLYVMLLIDTAQLQSEDNVK